MPPPRRKVDDDIGSLLIVHPPYVGETDEVMLREVGDKDLPAAVRFKGTDKVPSQKAPSAGDGDGLLPKVCRGFHNPSFAPSARFFFALYAGVADSVECGMMLIVGWSLKSDYSTRQAVSTQLFRPET
jgi:hypothetical protein